MATNTRLVTYLDTDPVIQYSPSLDDTVYTLGWLTSFPSVQNSSFGHAEYPSGVGDSRRTTGSAGASLQFQFYGSSALLYGSAPQVRYNVQVDNQPAKELTERDGVLASFTGLQATLHTVKLTVLETRGLTFSFDRVDFDIGMRGDWKNSTSPGRLGQPDWTFTGDDSWPWTNLTAKWSDGSSRTQSSVFTHAQGAKATFQFNGSAIYLWGNTLPDHGRFKVTLTSPDEPETTAIYQGRTKFTTVEALIYFRGGLNSSSTHNLTIENLDDSYLDVVRAVVATGEERHTYRGGNKPNIGVVVGCVLGGIACLLIFIGFILFILHNRRRTRRQMTKNTEDAHAPFSKATETSYPFTSYASASQAVESATVSSSDEQRVIQPYFTAPQHVPPIHGTVPSSEEKSRKWARMENLDEKATPPAYSEIQR